MYRQYSTMLFSFNFFMLAHKKMATGTGSQLSNPGIARKSLKKNSWKYDVTIHIFEIFLRRSGRMLGLRTRILQWELGIMNMIHNFVNQTKAQQLMFKSWVLYAYFVQNTNVKNQILSCEINSHTRTCAMCVRAALF